MCAACFVWFVKDLFSAVFSTSLKLDLAWKINVTWLAIQDLVVTSYARIVIKVPSAYFIVGFGCVFNCYNGSKGP